jgi:hypothetical protein
MRVVGAPALRVGSAKERPAFRGAKGENHSAHENTMRHFKGIGRLPQCLALAAIMLAGCGKSNMAVAPVSGKVTLDGAPLKSASVTFQPKDGGRPSFGVTNEHGRYVLEYSLNELGAKVGLCTVRITTESRSDDSGTKPSKELVPKRYKTTPIEVQVESKSNTIDIKLASK